MRYGSRLRTCCTLRQTFVFLLGAAIVVFGNAWVGTQNNNPQCDPNPDQNNVIPKNTTPEVTLAVKIVSMPVESLQTIKLRWAIRQTDKTEATDNVLSDSNDGVVADHAFPPSLKPQTWLTAHVDSEELRKLLLAFRTDSQAKVHAPPRLRMRNGEETTSIAEGDRVTGFSISAATGDLTQARQASARIIPEGTMLTFVPEVSGENISLNCKLKLARVEPVGAITYRRIGEPSGSDITLQASKLATSYFEHQAECLKNGESLVFATLRPDTVDEAIMLIATPRISDPGEDDEPWIRLQHRQENTKLANEIDIIGRDIRFSIVGPTTPDPPSADHDPLMDDQVLIALHRHALLSNAIIPADFEGIRNFKIDKEMTASFSDPPSFYPLVGNARLHRTQYTCTIALNYLGSHNGIAHKETQVVYVEHQQLHLENPDDDITSNLNSK
jgi:hypothetical protein